MRGRRDLLRNGLFAGLQADESLLLLSVAEASRKLPAIFAALAASGADVRGSALTQPSLESLFIRLTGKELRE